MAKGNGDRGLQSGPDSVIDDEIGISRAACVVSLVCLRSWLIGYQDAERLFVLAAPRCSLTSSQAGRLEGSEGQSLKTHSARALGGMGWPTT